jgi:hypothetical protein
VTRSESFVCLVSRHWSAEDGGLWIWRWEKELESARDCCGVYCKSEMGWKRKCPLSETGRKGGRRREGGSVGSVPQTL